MLDKTEFYPLQEPLRMRRPFIAGVDDTHEIANQTTHALFGEFAFPLKTLTVPVLFGSIWGKGFDRRSLHEIGSSLVTPGLIDRIVGHFSYPLDMLDVDAGRFRDIVGVSGNGVSKRSAAPSYNRSSATVFFSLPDECLEIADVNSYTPGKLTCFYHYRPEHELQWILFGQDLSRQVIDTQRDLIADGVYVPRPYLLASGFLIYMLLSGSTWDEVRQSLRVGLSIGDQEPTR